MRPVGVRRVVGTSSLRTLGTAPGYLTPRGLGATRDGPAPTGEETTVWLEMLKGWLDLAVDFYRLIWRVALVAIVAIATYTMMTRGTSG